MTKTEKAQEKAQEKAAAGEGGLDLDDMVAFSERQEDGTDVELIGLDGETPIGMTIHVLGMQGRSAQKAALSLHRMRAKEGDLRARDEIDEGDDMLFQLARLTKSWSPNPKIGGEVLECTSENAERLYRAIPTFYAQVLMAASKLAGFTKG